MSLEAQVLLSFLAHETDVTDVGRKTRITPVNYWQAFTDGTGAGQAQIVWSDSGTATTTPTDLNLAALPDTRDGAAVTVTFTAVKAVFVRNKSTTNALNVGGSFALTAAAVFPATVLYQVAAGGCYCVVSPTDEGITINPNGVRIARVAAASGTADYDIVFIGEGTIT